MTEVQESLEDAPWDGVEWRRWRASIQKEVSEQGDALDAVLEILESVGLGGPLHWETLSAPARAELLNKVADFVEFLERTYLREYGYWALKPCWWRHPAVVWQLTALAASFAHVYNPKLKPGLDQAAWHEHYLFPTLDRIRKNEAMTECKKGEHAELKTPRVMRDEDLDAWIENWKENNDEPLMDASRGDVVDAVRDRVERLHRNPAAGAGHDTTDHEYADDVDHPDEFAERDPGMDDPRDS